MKKILAVLALSAACGTSANGADIQPDSLKESRPVKTYRSSVVTTYLTFLNFGEEKTNTHHLEFHYRYKVTAKDVIGVKIATWKLFAPMGIQLWEPEFLDESEFYHGRLRETGIGFVYQRFLWRGLYASVELLPLIKIYLDTENHTIGNGFKLYTTCHFGYHFSLFRNRVEVEPQIHCNFWPIDTKGPAGFEALDTRWKNYMLFEPNLYIGVAF
jgi:hypothetical protein